MFLVRPCFSYGTRANAPPTADRLVPVVRPRIKISLFIFTPVSIFLAGTPMIATLTTRTRVRLLVDSACDSPPLLALHSLPRRCQVLWRSRTRRRPRSSAPTRRTRAPRLCSGGLGSPLYCSLPERARLKYGDTGLIGDTSRVHRGCIGTFRHSQGARLRGSLRGFVSLGLGAERARIGAVPY